MKTTQRKNALMILGTASHVGKSVLTAGLGRILADDGFCVAPFKAQNMSLNSAATPDGGEIGRAQALQAEACRVIPRVEMNPVLLKPSTDTGSQVILLGKIWGQVAASDYHTRRVEQLFPEVLGAYQRMAASHEVVLLEGAGSPVEINLREHDIVNLRMAHAADAACVLVADIDRGGAFASLLGTMELLEPADRARIRGFIINKFRGDESLLRSGIAMIEARLGLPCVGLVPFLHDLGLDEEDGVALENRASPARQWKDLESGLTRPIRIGVIALPHMANFTDFDALSLEPSVSLAFIHHPDEMAAADLVILPGTKQTLDDLNWLDQRDFIPPLRRLYDRGAPIIGICGGFQMLGTSIEDPHGIENSGKPLSHTGLGFLPVRTVLQTEKTVQRVRGTLRGGFFGAPSAAQANFTGYEIHVGETLYNIGACPLADIVRTGSIETVTDGAVSESGRVFGTYVHGFFDQDDFRHEFIQVARAAVDLAPATAWADVSAAREKRIDRLAGHLRQSLDLELLKSWLVAPATGKLVDTAAEFRNAKVNSLYKACVDDDALILSFLEPVRVLSWAVLNGGFCYADHVINHHVRLDDARFCARPALWLNEAATKLDLQGTVVAMATAVDMKNLVHVSLSHSGGEVTCFATVGCGNALSVGDPALITNETPGSLHTINMIVAVQPGLSDEAMVEGIQIVTEGRVRALYEAGISSSVSNLAATGTGTDCIAVISLGKERALYCGKHTQLGELIGRAAYTAVKNGVAFAADKTGNAATSG